MLPVAVLVAAASGCVAPTAPLESPAPTILSAVVTPSTVVAGQSMTADVVASHPSATVGEMAIRVVGPDGARFQHQDNGGCDSEGDFQAVATSTRIDSTTTESTLSCIMPADAPNGTWTVTLTVSARPYQTASMTTTVQVVGGTDGPLGPVITMVSPPPASAARGSSFPIEYRIDDVFPAPVSLQEPVNFILLSSPQGNLIGGFTCEDPVTIDATATEIDIARTCTVGADLHTGTYRSYLTALDQLDLSAIDNFAVTVT